MQNCLFAILKVNISYWIINWINIQFRTIVFLKKSLHAVLLLSKKINDFKKQKLAKSMERTKLLMIYVKRTTASFRSQTHLYSNNKSFKEICLESWGEKAAASHKYGFMLWINKEKNDNTKEARK